jgi:hypothetical protein
LIYIKLVGGLVLTNSFHNLGVAVAPTFADFGHYGVLFFHLVNFIYL